MAISARPHVLSILQELEEKSRKMTISDYGPIGV